MATATARRRTRRSWRQTRARVAHGVTVALAADVAGLHGAGLLLHGARAVSGAISARTSMRACPYCPGHRKVPVADWPAHYAAHQAWAEAEGARLRRRPVHEPAAPPHDRPVNTNKRPTKEATPRAPRTSRPPPPPAPEPAPTGPRIPIVDVPPPPLGARIRQWFTGPTGTPARTGGGAGRIWQGRTHNPGGNPVGTRPPRPGIAPVIPIHPGGPVTTTTTTKTGGGRHRPVRSAPPTGTGGGGTGGGATGGGGTGGGGGGDSTGMAEGFMRWARSAPETLVGAKSDAQTITEALAAVGDALRHRMESEVDRSIAAQCVEPYQDAMQHLQKAAEAGQEVYRRLTQRYGETAEFLARPDTPDPNYLKEGV